MLLVKISHSNQSISEAHYYLKGQKGLIHSFTSCKVGALMFSLGSKRR